MMMFFYPLFPFIRYCFGYYFQELLEFHTSKQNFSKIYVKYDIRDEFPCSYRKLLGVWLEMYQ